ncbi:MAG: SAM-dependent methyltransferase [Pseudomonadota bacterium]
MPPVPGRLYLVPNALDFGVAVPAGAAAPSLEAAIPRAVIAQAAALGHWIAENAKTTRAFLKRVDAVVPLAHALQSMSIVELPRPPKGRASDAVSAAALPMTALLAPALAGHDMGLISEAGLPGVADPGAAVVQAAHQAGLHVVALAGPSALVLALAASGLQGQSFAFVGYLPVDSAARAQRIRELESTSRRHDQTQLMIETPYRNPALFSALLEHLQTSTRLSVSCGLTLAQGFSRTDTVAGWRSRPGSLPTDVPAVFSLQAARG